MSESNVSHFDLDRTLEQQKEIINTNLRLRNNKTSLHRNFQNKINKIQEQEILCEHRENQTRKRLILIPTTLVLILLARLYLFNREHFNRHS